MTETTTGYTAAQAIRSLYGVSKKRFYEMMNDGEISFTIEEWGQGTRRIGCW